MARFDLYLKSSRCLLCWEQTADRVGEEHRNSVTVTIRDEMSVMEDVKKSPILDILDVLKLVPTGLNAE